jgi:hypothetical protein
MQRGRRQRWVPACGRRVLAAVRCRFDESPLCGEDFAWTGRQTGGSSRCRRAAFRRRSAACPRSTTPVASAGSRAWSGFGRVCVSGRAGAARVATSRPPQASWSSRERPRIVRPAASAVRTDGTGRRATVAGHGAGHPGPSPAGGAGRCGCWAGCAGTAGWSCWRCCPTGARRWFRRYGRTSRTPPTARNPGR